MAMETNFSDLAQLCLTLEQTTKRTEMIRLVGDFLRSLRHDEIAPAVLMTVGKVFPTSDPRTLDVSWKTIQSAQSSLSPRIAAPPLTILDVYHHFSRIASAVGKGSRKKKEILLADMLSRASESEAKYLIKIIFGEMQHGVAAGVMLEAIARSAAVEPKLIRRAFMFTGDLGKVATVALDEGVVGLRAVGIQVFTPIQPMLAQLAQDVAEALAQHEGRTALEYKFDGARVQIHKSREAVKIFSRNLSNVSESLPEVIELTEKELKIPEAVVEGEVIAVGEDEKPLPFQQIMRRFRRVHQVDKMTTEVPVRLYLFDLLYLEGKPLIDAAYEKRRTLLADICAPHLLAPRVVTDSISVAEEFLRQAMDSGHEGLMAKSLASPYTPGARGKNWLKIKPAEHLDLTIVAADWGYGRREGWLSNYHLAARDQESGRLHPVGKTFKGLTDEEFGWMTERLQAAKSSETPTTVFVRPEIIVEVAYNEIQKSPHYQSGFALRFARISRIREDKSVEQIDTIQTIGELYQKQFERKGRK